MFVCCVLINQSPECMEVTLENTLLGAKDRRTGDWDGDTDQDGNYRQDHHEFN